MRASRLALVTALLMTSGAALAAETISYKYDARGRLLEVARSGGLNNLVTTTYAHDRANNRLRKSTVGASNTKPFPEPEPEPNPGPAPGPEFGSLDPSGT